MKQHDRVDNSSVAPGGAPTDVHARSKLSDFGQIEESLKAAPTDATFAYGRLIGRCHIGQG